ncbi:hypothetical protein CR513_17309, partial [Mucuna pruriens]
MEVVVDDLEQQHEELRGDAYPDCGNPLRPARGSLISRKVEVLERKVEGHRRGREVQVRSGRLVPGERIEVGVRNGKIMHMATRTIMAKKVISSAEKRKGEVNAITSPSARHNSGTSQETSNYQPHLPHNTSAIAPQPYAYHYPY